MLASATSSAERKAYQLTLHLVHHQLYQITKRSSPKLVKSESEPCALWRFSLRLYSSFRLLHSSAKQLLLLAVQHFTSVIPRSSAERFTMSLQFHFLPAFAAMAQHLSLFSEVLKLPPTVSDAAFAGSSVMVLKLSLQLVLVVLSWLRSSF